MTDQKFAFYLYVDQDVEWEGVLAQVQRSLARRLVKEMPRFQDEMKPSAPYSSCAFSVAGEGADLYGSLILNRPSRQDPNEPRYDLLALIVEGWAFQERPREEDEPDDDEEHAVEGLELRAKLLGATKDIAEACSPIYGCERVYSGIPPPTRAEIEQKAPPRLFRGNLWSAKTVGVVGVGRLKAVTDLHLRDPERFKRPWLIDELRNGSVLFYEDSSPSFTWYFTPVHLVARHLGYPDNLIAQYYGPEVAARM